MPPCSIADCDRPARHRGWCHTHYMRWCRHGDVTRGRPSPTDRFWASVTRGKGCWAWRGPTNDTGYGLLSIDSRHVRAHRFAYELLVGPIPDGLHVCHRCDNPPCVNPAHLFLGTPADNGADRDRKGRTAFPPRMARERNPAAKLRRPDVDAIRAAITGKRGEQAALARRYGVSQSQISSIVRGQSWR